MPPQNAEEKLVQRRVADAVKAVAATGRPKFTGFLNDREADLARAEANRHKECGCHFFGGYEGAERTMLCVFEDLEPPAREYPIKAIRIAVKAEGLTHRDYLGALLGTGLERSCIGDIVTDAEGALVYVQERVAPFILDEVKSVGRYAAAVSLANTAQQDIAAHATGQQNTASVASLRLDAVLGAMLHVSRSDAAALVARGLVQVNHLDVASGSYILQGGDVLSIRGKGKYALASVGGKSRKNRIFITYTQY